MLQQSVKLVSHNRSYKCSSAMCDYNRKNNFWVRETVNLIFTITWELKKQSIYQCVNTIVLFLVQYSSAFKMNTQGSKQWRISQRCCFFLTGGWKLRFLRAANPFECSSQWGDTLSNFCIMPLESLLHPPQRLCTISMQGWHFPERGIPSYFSVSDFFLFLPCDLCFGEKVARVKQPLCI